MYCNTIDFWTKCRGTQSIARYVEDLFIMLLSHLSILTTLVPVSYSVRIVGQTRKANHMSNLNWIGWIRSNFKTNFRKNSKNKKRPTRKNSKKYLFSAPKSSQIKSWNLFPLWTTSTLKINRYPLSYLACIIHFNIAEKSHQKDRRVLQSHHLQRSQNTNREYLSPTQKLWK